MEEPIIHVGIMSAPKVNFALAGKFSMSGTHEQLEGPCTACVENGRICVERADRRWILPGVVTLSTAEASSASFTLSNVTIGVQFHWERNEDQRFVGALRLVVSDGSVTAINVVSIEDYLTSVISSEMSATSSAELLKAHAITSRSWLLAQLEKSRQLKGENRPYQATFESSTERIRWYDREDHHLFDVCADDHCQRYQGVTMAYTPKVKEAVEATFGMVLMAEGKICDARFSKSCGGISESFENAWEPVLHSYLVPVTDFPAPPDDYDLDLTKEENAEKWIRSSPPAFCNTADRRILSQVLVRFDQETTDFYRWRAEYTQYEIADIIRKRSGIDFGDILDLIPAERGASGRMIRLRIVGSKKTLVIGKDLEIRRTLSTSHLYSSAFVVEKYDVAGGVPKKFALVGAGWGHGVGLCQIGAAVMGEMGYPYDKILAHYFTGAEVRKLY